ncbi:MAG: guanylate kinase [Acidobacteriota bacterium]|nr:guanylate kinase [Blastocatellia bacterium]MDW8238591.1 guanylate kinase [Acidobacteriota bacterium]
MSSNRNFLVVISSPSGGGKTTIVKALLERVPQTRLSVSHTTRKPRSNEVHGQDYFFVSRDDFLKMRAQGEFLESAEVFGNLYGTSKRMVDEILAAHCDVILDIDVQGAAQIRAHSPDALTIFLMPPSFDELKRRLNLRGTETPASMSRRLEVARQEVTRYAEFDYLVINDELQEACRAVEAIVRAERHRRVRQEEEARAILQTFM